MADFLKIHPSDNVVVALRDLQIGETFLGVTLKENIPQGHKFALSEILLGQDILKYKYPIGHAKTKIAVGAWVHTHNVKTNLYGELAYTFEPETVKEMGNPIKKTFLGFERPCGRVGIRNELWIIPTVGCVNQSAKLIAEGINKMYSDKDNFDGAVAIVHPYGCSQLGEDHIRTRFILSRLAKHANAGGVLILGLGCENNTITEFKTELGEYNPEHIRFLIAQEVDDEVEDGISIAKELVEHMTKTERTVCNVDKLVIGLKCGGSDAFSGITANPLVGSVSDLHIASGGATVLTEVPEMFGAEQILMHRAESKVIFTNIVKMINDFKGYYARHNQPVYENPSPGNKAGGITTLEDKSLGCVQKGGTSRVVDVLNYGEQVRKTGLSLLDGPGNDIVACTDLAASGCHVILFTTGRGTPLGTVIPTLKIATNTNLYNKKRNWMDMNAGQLLDGVSMEKLTDELYDLILSTASGRTCKAEDMGYREVAIFKTGVTL